MVVMDFILTDPLSNEFLFRPFHGQLYKAFQRIAVLVLGKGMQCSDRFVPVFEHTRMCMCDPACFRYHLNQSGYRPIIFVLVLHHIDHPPAIRLGDLVQCEDQWQGQFFLFDVQSRWFANILAVAVVEQIIFYLERNAGVLPEFVHTLHGFKRLTCRACSTGTASCDQAGCFLADYVEINVLLEIQVSRFLKLKQFAFGHFTHSSAYDLQQLEFILFDR